ncbi:hypothetical protein KKB44_01500 [Candidatus Micrarchaeota archaeon]|nr:hypothetical protein [Candidatus Micrarchaeota archaeon]
MIDNSENPEFMKTIEEIRDAEQEYDRIITEAQKRAERILRETKEKIYEEREKSEEQLVAFKNETVRNGSKDIETKVQSTVKKAKDEAEKITHKKLDKKEVSKLVKEFLNTL